MIPVTERFFVVDYFIFLINEYWNSTLGTLVFHPFFRYIQSFSGWIFQVDGYFIRFAGSHFIPQNISYSPTVHQIAQESVSRPGCWFTTYTFYFAIFIKNIALTCFHGIYSTEYCHPRFGSPVESLDFLPILSLLSVMVGMLNTLFLPNRLRFLRPGKFFGFIGFQSSQPLSSVSHLLQSPLYSYSYLLHIQPVGVLGIVYYSHVVLRE